MHPVFTVFLVFTKRKDMLTKPMLAASYEDGAPLEFPVLATPKVDGVRALIVNGTLVSRSFRPIPNDNVRAALEKLLPEGADGEISCGNLYETTSVVMSRNATFVRLDFSWFDWAFDLNAPYLERTVAVAKHKFTDVVRGVRVVPLVPATIETSMDLEHYENRTLALGYEGVVVRSPYGRYKCGRSTLREGLMVKIKRCADYEAHIVGTEELMHNTNETQADNFGNAKRSSAKKGLVAGKTLGAIVASHNGELFKVGTGLSTDQRDALWANRDTIVGLLVKYKCAGFGSKGQPRSPVFLGIRSIDDM